ncbi:MAG TPA: dCTP deaminase, partial [Thermoanaerobaculia bacterium]|nr:dCTP deaminase [Thermoanaerobaculia bacterium]
MIKPDSWIRSWGSAGGVEPYTPEQVNAASYDVRLSDHWICPTRDPEEFRAPHIKLFPSEVVLASTLEYVRIPRNVACDLKLKSTLGRLWINHSLAGWCDPGFQGNITLELQNLGPVPF